MSSAQSIDEMEFAFQQAEKARRSGNFSQALDQYLTILSDRLWALAKEPSPELTAADMVITERAADLAVLFGHYRGADNLLAGMVSALESAQNFYSADFITVKRIHLALSVSQLDDAKQLLQAMSRRIGDVETLTITDEGLRAWEPTCRWEGATPRDRAVIFSQLYFGLGWLLTSLGQYEPALLMLNRGLEFTGKEAPDLAQRAEVPLRLTVVSALLEKGDLDQAGEKLDELAPLLNKNRRPGSYVRAAELRGKLRMLQGNFGAALLEFSEVRASCEDKAFARAELIAMLNLSQVLIFLNFIAAAQQLLDSVVSRARALNDPDAIARAALQSAIARERSASFEGNAAVAKFRRVRRQVDAPRAVPATVFPEITPGESYLSLFEDRTLEFYWQLGNRNLDLASVICSHLSESFGMSDSKLVLVRLQVIEGTLAYFKEDFKRSERLLSQSLPALQAMGLQPDIWQAQRILGWCWLRLGFPISDYQQLAKNNQQVLATMTASLPPAYQAVYLLNKWTAEEEFIAGEINQLEELRAAISTSNWFRRPGLRWSLKKRIYQLQQYIERYKDSLTKDSKQDQAPAKEAEPSLLKFLWNQPRDRATLSFLVLPDRVFVVQAGWMKLDYRVAAVSRIDVRELVRRWHVSVISSSGRGVNTAPAVAKGDLIDDEYLDGLVAAQRNIELIEPDGAAEPDEDANSIAATLAQHLMIPDLLDGLSSRVRALTIIPHDALLGFPFAAVKHEGSYLGEEFNLSTDIGLIDRPRASGSLTETKALLVGVSSKAGEFAELPGVRREIGTLSEWFGERKLSFKILMNEDAVKSSIIRYLNDATLLHIACHGVFRADQPDASGLVLITLTNQAEVLSLRELSAMDLSNLRHVSLSSCSSADNFIVPGRWIIGLPETLRRGGIESVLACLWAINDQFATAFAVRFYDYLASHPRDEALKLTQLDCLKKKHRDGQLRPLENVEGIDTTDPVHWASYVLCGSHDRLRL